MESFKHHRKSIHTKLSLDYKTALTCSAMIIFGFWIISFENYDVIKVENISLMKIITRYETKYFFIPF